MPGFICDRQCFGSVTLPYGPGSGPPTNGSGSGSCYFNTDLQDANKKIFLFIYGTLTSFFSKDNVIKKSQNSRNQGFPYFLGLIIEGFGSGSEPMTNGSGSRRPKNILIRIRYTSDRDASIFIQVPSPCKWVNYNYKVTFTFF